MELLLDGLPSTIGGTFAGAVPTAGYLARATPFDAAALAWLGAVAAVALGRALYLGATMLPVAARLALSDSDGLRALALVIAAYLVVLGVASRATARGDAAIPAAALRERRARRAARRRGASRGRRACRGRAGEPRHVDVPERGDPRPDAATAVAGPARGGPAAPAGRTRGPAGRDADEDEVVLARGMHESVRALEDLFGSILDVSGLEAGTVRARPRDAALDDVLERVRRSFEPLARAAGIELVVAPTGAFVRTDPELLERLVGNLVSNAVRYTPAGEVRVAASPGDASQVDGSGARCGASR